MTSTVGTNGSSASGEFPINGLPRWTDVFGEARHTNLIEPVVNIARRHEIPHRRRKNGVRFGRKPKMTPQQVWHARQLQAEDKQSGEICSILGVEPTTLWARAE